MGSFASAPMVALLLALALPGGLSAQAASAAPRPIAPRHVPPSVPAPLAAQVAGLVARQWGDDSAAIRLEWGALPTVAAFPAGTTARVLGRGEGGWLGVVFQPSAGSPFAARLHAGSMDSVVVAARAVSEGTTLEPADTRIEIRVRWGPPLSRASARPGPGWTVRRSLAPGDLLTPALVRPAPLVKAGETVQLEWRTGPVAVVLSGTALNSAGLGEPVRVRLASRGGERRGIVTAPGAARLDS
jgi:flagella basal body P-ring formation protein FlgA